MERKGKEGKEKKKGRNILSLITTGGGSKQDEASKSFSLSGVSALLVDAHWAKYHMVSALGSFGCPHRR